MPQFILRLFVLLSLIVGVCSFDAQAQRKQFYNYSIAQGLVQTQVLAIEQDIYNQIWFGTYGGISIFDGSSFDNLTKANTLPANLITSLYRDKSGTMWMCTSTGIYKYNGRKFIPCLTDTVWNSGFHQTKFVESNNGAMWLLSGGKLYERKDLNFRQIETTNVHLVDIYIDVVTQTLLVLDLEQGVLKLNAHNKLEHYAASLQAVEYYRVLAATNSLLVYTSKGIMMCTDGKWTVDTRFKDLLKEHALTAYLQDNGGDIWLATTAGGVYHYKDKAWQYYNSKSGLNEEIILSLFEDNQHNVWLGSNGNGVYRYTKSPFTFFDVATYFNSSNATYLAEDKQGQLFMTNSKGELFQYKQQTFVPVVHSKGPGFLNFMFTNAQKELTFLSGNNGLWNLENGALFPQNGAQTKDANYYYAAYSNGQMDYLVGFNGFVAYKNMAILDVHSFPSNIQNFTLLNDDHVLVGTNNRNLIYNLTAKKVRDTVLDGTAILDSDAHGDLVYLATDDKGLVIFNTQDGTYKTVSHKDGLSCDYSYSVLKDSRGAVWVGTGCGIDRISFNGDSVVIRNFGASDGIIGVEANSGAILEDIYGNIWFGTNKGVYKYVPQDDDIVQSKPLLLIKNIFVFSKPLYEVFDGKESWSGNAMLPNDPVLPNDFNHITFQFKAINLSGSDKVRYRYQLIGEGNDDIYETNQTSIVFSNLSSGEYIFKIWATDNMGVWYDNAVSYPFEIKAKFYNTGLFRIALIFFAVALYFGIRIFRYKQKTKKLLWEERLREEEKDKVRQRTAEDFHDEIGNKLTRIKLLTNIVSIKMKDADSDTQKMIQQINHASESLYKGAKDIIWTLQPQSDYLSELLVRIRANTEEMISYANIVLDFQQEFTDNTISLHQFDNIKLENEYSRNIIMIFKEAVNNCVKHSGATQISLIVKVGREQCTIQMRDNGKGLNGADKPDGNGLKNMQRRADRINALFTISANKGNGVQIELLFSYKKNYK